MLGKSILYQDHPARVVGTIIIFGETYLDVFIEPAGPIRRVLLKDVEQRPSPLHALTQPTAAHPPALPLKRLPTNSRRWSPSRASPAPAAFALRRCPTRF
jgi:hypothetical protein